MKLGVLFSGGKDSCAAAAVAQRYGHEVACLLSIQSKNKDSFMFHTPNISLVEQQAEAMDIPIIVQDTEGEKEKELDDLKLLIQKGVEEHQIEGVVTGAVASVYQATRVQKICHELGLWCFNPLWQRDPYEHIEQLVKEGFEIYIGGIAAYPLNESFLGKRIGEEELVELKQLQEQHQVNPSGEGGEFETFVAHGPGWKKRIIIRDADNEFENHAGVWQINNVELVQEEKELGKRENIRRDDGGVLLLSTCSEPLSELEFVLPIANIVGDCTIKHHSDDFNPNDYSKIIICGTAIKDDEFLKGDWEWIRNYDKPVLGICAGYQLLGLSEGKELMENLEIGMKNIGDKEVYLLHHQDLKDTNYEFQEKNKLGILYHPEVRNEVIVKEFIQS